MYILKWHWASDVNYTITNIHTSDIVTSLPCHHFCVQTVPPCLYKCLQHFSSSFGGINKHKNRWHYYYVMTKLNWLVWWLRLELVIGKSSFMWRYRVKNWRNDNYTTYTALWSSKKYKDEAKDIQNICKVKLKIIERTWDKIVDFLHKSNALSNEDFVRQNYWPCSSAGENGIKDSCKRRGVLFET